MKVLSVLLSLIVLMLTSIPCCAFEFAEGTYEGVERGMPSDDNCSEDCSPFYTCGTCIGFTIGGYLNKGLSFYVVRSGHNPFDLPFELQQTAASIWHPPKSA